MAKATSFSSPRPRRTDRIGRPPTIPSDTTLNSSPATEGRRTWSTVGRPSTHLGPKRASLQQNSNQTASDLLSETKRPCCTCDEFMAETKKSCREVGPDDDSRSSNSIKRGCGDCGGSLAL